jgi:hypothetical protein
MNTQPDKSLREHLLDLLSGGGAHVDFDKLVEGLSPSVANTRVSSLPYTIWHVLEHMRIAQWDILEFSRNSSHVSPPFPDGYWPSLESDASPTQLENTIAGFRADLAAMQELVSDSRINLMDKFSHGDGQTLLREALLVADHNAYHLGALAVMKRLVEGKDQASGPSR